MPGYFPHTWRHARRSEPGDKPGAPPRTPRCLYCGNGIPHGARVLAIDTGDGQMVHACRAHGNVYAAGARALAEARAQNEREAVCSPVLSGTSTEAAG